MIIAKIGKTRENVKPHVFLTNIKEILPPIFYPTWDNFVNIT